MPTKTRAIVAHEPVDGKPGPNWALEDIEVGDIGDGEVLVEMVATGVCHTDIVLTSVPQGMLGIEYPKLAGHEGSGYVRQVGSAVTKVVVGDPVLLSFDHCTSCTPCKSSHPAFCDSFGLLNYIGQPAKFKCEKGDVWGRYFGQSSFANHSIVSEASVLNAKSLLQDEGDLKLFAPLGCGFQTGAGAIVNIADASPADRVVVLGLGGVGMAAIAAAKVVGCKVIIGVDRVPSRLELAKTFGATHTIDTTVDMDINAQVRKIDSDGASIVLDTTGAPPVIEAGLKAVGRRGKYVLIGVPPHGYEVKLDVVTALDNGTQLIGCIEGDSEPAKVGRIAATYRWAKNLQCLPPDDTTDDPVV